MSRLPLIEAGVLGLVLCIAAPAMGGNGRKAAASKEDRASKKQKDLLQKGDEARARGQWAQALEMYQRAYDQKPLPPIQFQIAECHRGMGNAGRAAFAYRQYLKYGVDIPNRGETEELAARMEQLAAAARSGLGPEPQADEQRKTADNCPGCSDKGK